MYCGKMAEWICILFGMMSGVGRGMSVLHGSMYSKGKCSFGGLAPIGFNGICV